MTDTTLPKGITRLPAAAPVAHPPGHPQGAAADPEAHIAANIQTAADMHKSLGQKIEDVAQWLLTQLPGIFTNLAAAIAAIKKVL